MTTPLVTVLDTSYGSAKSDGGTQYPANWYLADSTGAVISVYKEEAEGLLSLDPVRPDNVIVAAGFYEVFPLDAGGTQQLSGYYLDLEPGSPAAGTLPTPLTASMSDLVSPGSSQYLGHYVKVPAGNYTQDWHASAFSYTSSTSGKTYQDGVSISDGSNTVLIDTYTFEYSSGSSACIPPDGGQPDLSNGDFNGVFDVEETDDGAVNSVIFYGSCGH
jgi:hypothetical protein